MARSRMVRKKEREDKAHISMDAESRKRVGESSIDSVLKSRKRKSLASPSPAPRRGAQKKKPRRRKEEEVEEQFALKDPGILDQKEENGKVYYLVAWADDPDTGQVFDPTWEPYNFVTPDVVAEWQNRRTPLEQARAEDEVDSQDYQQPEIIDLTDDSIQDSQPPRPEKRRKITHGLIPTAEEETPERKPRKVGTVESARFQSVSTYFVGEEEKPYEIKDSYEEEHELSSAGVGKARVEIPIPDGFDRDGYSKIVTSSQPSQPSYTSQLPQSSELQSAFLPKLQTPAHRHKYSSLIWDEDIEGAIPDSQESGSSSYKPSGTQVSNTLSTFPEITGTDLNTGAVENSQVTSGEEFSASETVESCYAEPLAGFTQASYVETGIQSSSVQTGAPSTDPDQAQTLTQASRDSQTQGSGPQEPATGSTDFFQPGAHQISSPDSGTSSEPPFTGAAQALQSDFNLELSTEPSSEDTSSSHNSFAQQVVNQPPSLNLQTSSDSSSLPPEARLENTLKRKSPTQHDEISPSPPHLPTAEDSLPRPVDSLTERHIDHQLSQPSQASVSEVEVSSSIEFGTQVPFRTVEDENSHLISSSPHIRSSSIRSSSVSSPYVSAVESPNQIENPTSQSNSSLEQDIQESQTVQRSHRREVAPDGSISPLEGTSQILVANQASLAAPATPVQTPREDVEQISADKTSESVTSSPLSGLNIITQCSLSPLKSQGLPSHQTRSTEQRSQESSSSLPSPPFEKADSSAEQFAQLTSQNRPSTPSPALQTSESLGKYSSSQAPPTQEKPSQQLPSSPLQSFEELEVIFKPSQTPDFGSPFSSPAPIRPLCAESTIRSSENKPSVRAPPIIDLTMDDPPTTTPAKPDNPVLAKLKVRKAEALARRAAERERERAASASRSLPESPAPLSPALQSAALQSAAVQSPVLLSPEPMAAAEVVNDAAVKSKQVLPLQQTIEDAAPPSLEPILSPRVSPEEELEADLEVELPPTNLRILPQGREEYAVPLPMVSYAQDVYVNAIRTRKSQRYAFLTDEVFDADLVKDIDAMLEDLDQLCSHQDLIVEDFSTQRMDAIERQAKWAENVSTKCIFLAEFLSLMQTEPKQIAILVRPGRMLEILEALFIWHGFVYNRADRSGYTGNTSGGPMQISLIPTRGEILGFDPPSIIIAFDSSYTSVPFLEDLRVDTRFPKKVVPLLQLIVTHSIEHLEKCFHGNLEPVERKIRLVSCLTQIGDGVGKLDINYYPPPKAASAVAEYVVNGTVEGTWPLLPMPEIEDLKLDIDSSQPRQPSQEEASRFAPPSSDISIAQASQFGMKRQLQIGDDEGHESPKRQRLTPVPGEADPSHVSDTVLHTSSGKASSASAEASKVIAKPPVLDNEQGSNVSVLLKMVNDLEIQLRSREAIESELRQINHDLENRCQDYESSIASIQPKYQEALNDRGHFEHEYNISSLRQANLRKELENKEAEATKLREQKATLQAELTEVRTTLSSSSIPEIAEIGKLKEELAKEKSEKERLEKRLKNMQSDLEYMRNNYQHSSTLAAEHASENQALQTELDKLREKDKRDMVRIHEIQKSNEVKEYLNRIQTLKEEKSDIERELEKKQEELRAVMNGRRATRGTSVPRSPRMGTGGTMSPGPRSMGRAMQIGNIGMAMSGGNGSRGTSPVPGELGGFRGTGPFVGEALFQDNRAPGGVSSRWGNHLQQ